MGLKRVRKQLEKHLALPLSEGEVYGLKLTLCYVNMEIDRKKIIKAKEAEDKEDKSFYESLIDGFSVVVDNANPEPVMKRTDTRPPPSPKKGKTPPLRDTNTYLEKREKTDIHYGNVDEYLKRVEAVYGNDKEKQ